ncbi:hypothetical protein HYZ70_01675 [Candidatus Curtissbacteria bacterium]|nr:hypothetical protein [Candidatus Curtissbacteria bacterium]
MATEREPTRTIIPSEKRHTIRMKFGWCLDRDGNYAMDANFYLPTREAEIWDNYSRQKKGNGAGNLVQNGSGSSKDNSLLASRRLR